MPGPGLDAQLCSQITKGLKQQLHLARGDPARPGARPVQASRRQPLPEDSDGYFLYFYKAAFLTRGRSVCLLKTAPSYPALLSHFLTKNSEASKV